MKLFIRPLRVLFLTLLSYLLDVCVMRHLYIGSVTASASLAGIAIITVSYGKKAAFFAGCIIGILMECMLASVPVLYLLSYPIITMLCAQMTRLKALYLNKIAAFFKRIIQFFRRDENMNPYLRIPLCALTESLLFNTVLIVYGYISDFGLDSGHIMRAAASCLYTVALSIVLMLPYRAVLKLLGRRNRPAYMNEGEQA